MPSPSGYCALVVSFFPEMFFKGNILEHNTSPIAQFILEYIICTVRD